MNHDLVVSLVMSLNMFFTLLRVVANVPQLIAVVRDPCGARAISVGSWAVFSMANASNGVYALVMASDRTMFALNLVSAMSCGTIAVTALIRQRRAVPVAHDVVKHRADRPVGIAVRPT